jgi:hypothetical protein
MLQIQDHILSAGRSGGQFFIEVIGRGYRRVVVRIASGKGRNSREVVVNFADYVFFISQPGGGEIELPGIAVKSAIGEGVKRQIRFDTVIYSDLGEGTASTVGANESVVGVRGESICRSRLAL